MIKVDIQDSKQDFKEKLERKLVKGDDSQLFANEEMYDEMSKFNVDKSVLELVQNLKGKTEDD